MGLSPRPDPNLIDTTGNEPWIITKLATPPALARAAPGPEARRGMIGHGDRLLGRRTRGHPLAPFDKRRIERGVEAMIDQLAAKYTANRDAISTDVIAMLQDLADKGFLTEAREKMS